MSGTSANVELRSFTRSTSMLYWEHGIVARPVVTIARTAVVGGTCGQRSLIEGLDLLPASCLECEMSRHDVRAHNPEVGILAVVEAGRLAVLQVVLLSEGRQGLHVKGL